jgi:ADP-heptose:LPS heptosyltransferase
MRLPEAPDARLLFVTLSNIGDMVLTTPALEALHAAYPDHRIDIIADARSSALLEFCPYRGDLLHRDKRAGWRGMLHLIHALRRRRYTAVVDLRTDFLPWVLKTGRRTARWRAGPHGPHAVDQHYAIAARVLPNATRPPPARVWLAPGDAEWADATLAALNDTGPWLALAPGANWPGKIWPLAHYKTLLEEVAPLFGGILVLGSVQDRSLAAELRTASPLPCLDCTGNTTLTQAAALLDHAGFFVGNDSGLGHIAAARGVHTLTLMGPGRPERYKPFGPKATLVEAPSRDLTRLTPALVGATVREKMAAKASGTPSTQ